MLGRSSWKVRSRGVRVVSQSPAPKESLATAARDFVISPGDIPIVVRRDGPPKTISDKIKQITLAKVIGFKGRVRIVNYTHAGIARGAVGIARGTLILDQALP